MSNAFRDKILSLGLIVRGSPRLEYGSNAPSEYVSSKETGGLPALIMSDGCLEKEEIADIKAAVIEKEQKRIKTRRQSAQKTNIESLVNLANQTPKGKRSKAINEAIKGIGG